MCWLVDRSVCKQRVSLLAEIWIDQQERSNPLALRIICRFAQWMPRIITRLWLWPITLYFFLFAPAARSASRHYLCRVLGSRVRWYHVFIHLHCFASIVLDRVYFLTDRFDKFKIDICGTELLEQALEDSTGAVLLGAHVGSFEALRCLAIRHANLPLKIMMYQDHNAMITRLLDELNPQVAKSVINLADPNALLQAREVIESGGFVGMLGDRVLPTEKTVAVKFLDTCVDFPAGPVSVAAMLGVPVFLFFGVYRGGNRYQVHLYQLSEGKQIDRKARDEYVAALVQRYADTIESVLFANPYNWFNFYDYWGDVA